MPSIGVTPTAVFDSYWRFAAKRHAIYERRLADPDGPWTDDPILQTYRFTNAYRAADRVSQYLMREVQYREDRSQAPDEVFFRTMLFKIFNKIETWELLEDRLGPLSWQSADMDAIASVLDNTITRGVRIYSAAYIMPAPRFGHTRKHANHLALLKSMMADGLAGRICASPHLRNVFDLLKGYSGLGPFLAFQYAIDLNYSSMLSFDEHDFVVAGPGALDGISKCFEDTEGRSAEAVIYWMVEAQEAEFARRGVDFPGLFGRRLQPIDCQNLFCEISKYARVAHPEIAGVTGRTRIKQSYRRAAFGDAPPFFPLRWGLNVPAGLGVRTSAWGNRQKEFDDREAAPRFRWSERGRRSGLTT